LLRHPLLKKLRVSFPLLSEGSRADAGLPADGCRRGCCDGSTRARASRTLLLPVLFGYRISLSNLFLLLPVELIGSAHPRALFVGVCAAPDIFG
jgi:hypothetical protein